MIDLEATEWTCSSNLFGPGRLQVEVSDIMILAEMVCIPEMTICGSADPQGQVTEMKKHLWVLPFPMKSHPKKVPILRLLSLWFITIAGQMSPVSRLRNSGL